MSTFFCVLKTVLRFGFEVFRQPETEGEEGDSEAQRCVCVKQLRTFSEISYKKAICLAKFGPHFVAHLELSKSRRGALMEDKKWR